MTAHIVGTPAYSIVDMHAEHSAGEFPVSGDRIARDLAATRLLDRLSGNPIDRYARRQDRNVIMVGKVGPAFEHTATVRVENSGSLWFSKQFYLTDPSTARTARFALGAAITSFKSFEGQL